MTFRKLMMLAGIGGFVYAHQKRGGQLSVASFKDTGRELFGSAKTRVEQLRTQAEGRIQEVVGEVKEKLGNQKTEVAGVEQGGQFADDVSGYGSSGYGYRR